MDVVNVDATQRKLIMWRGSQFSIKAIAALAVKGLWPGEAYSFLSVPLAIGDRKRLLPPPHTVPMLLWDGEVIAGTDHICTFLDATLPAAPKLYPDEAAAEVASIEKRCADLYWHNGWLSTVDPEGLERYVGEFLRTYARRESCLARFVLGVAPNRGNRLLANIGAVNPFLDLLRRRGGAVGKRLARTKDAAAVFREAHDELRALDELLAASPTVWFCGSPTPTAADLTLYGMLERWLGDSLMPGRHGPAQPTIIDGLPAVRASWEEARRLFVPRCNVDQLSEETGYVDIAQPVGPATWPKHV